MEVGVSRWFSTRVEWIALDKENVNLEWTGVRGHRLLNLMNLYNARLITKSLDSVWAINQSKKRRSWASFHLKAISQNDGELQGNNSRVNKVSEGVAMIV